MPIELVRLKYGQEQFRRKPATRQDKDQIGLYEAAILDAAKTREELNSMNDQFYEDVKSGKFSEDELKEKQEQRDQKQSALEQKLENLDNYYNQDVNVTPEEKRNNDFEDYASSPFRNNNVTANKTNGISSADPEIETDVQLSGDFKMASEGDINEQEQQPAVDLKEQKIMSLQSPTVS